MKTQALFASIALALAGSAFAAGDKHDHKPLHGGVVVEPPRTWTTNWWPSRP